MFYYLIMTGFHILLIFFSRNAQTSMKPDAAENSEFLPEMDKGVKVVTDEVVNGEYGLVINGHSLVHTCIQFQFMCMLSLSNFKRCAYFVTGELLPYANAVLSFLLRA